MLSPLKAMITAVAPVCVLSHAQYGNFTTHDFGAFTGLQRTFSGSDTWNPDSAFQSNG
jgi:hypothetical protein